MSLRDSSSLCLESLVKRVGLEAENKELFQEVITRNLLPLVKDGIKHKQEVVDWWTSVWLLKPSGPEIEICWANSINALASEILAPHRWMSLDLNNDKLTLVQTMAWCLQAPSHYLNQCWIRSMTPYGITRPQWVDFYIILLYAILCYMELQYILKIQCIIHDANPIEWDTDSTII